MGGTRQQRHLAAHPPGDDRVAAVLERLPAVVWTTDVDLAITTIEGSGLAAIGLDEDQVVGLTVDEIFAATGDPVPRDAHHRAVAGDTVHYSHSWAGRTYEVDLQPRRDGDGNITGVIGVALDATRRTQLEADLVRAIERYEHVQRATSDAIFDWDVTSQEFRGGVGLTRFGYSPSDGRTLGWWRERIHADDQMRILDSLRSFLDGHGDTWTTEFRLRRAAGTYADVMVRAYIVRDERGRPTRATGTLSDVSDARHHHRALRESEQRFRALVMNAADAILVLDERGGIAYASPGAIGIVGYTPDELAGRVGFAFVHPDDLEAAIDALGGAVAAPGRNVSVRARVVRRDGAIRHVDARIVSLLEEPSVRGIVVNARDVTDQVEADATRRRLEAELEVTRRLESLGRLAGGVAHDFNNLLGVIMNYAHLAATGLGDGHPAAADIAEIEKAAQRGAALTSQLLLIGRHDEGDPSVLCVNDAVAGLRSLLQTSIGDAIRLETDLEDGLPPVRIDPHRLEQVLVNLVLNARDAMPEGGTLWISTRRADDGRDGSWVRLSVADTGTGMPPDVLDRIFDPFFTTKPAGAGTGLGLTTAYGIVSQAGGSISARSRSRAGTVFDVHLPVTEDGSGPC